MPAYEIGKEVIRIDGGPTGITLLSILKKRKSPERLRGLFRCHCGNQWVTWIGDVRSGKTGSCGCLQHEHKWKRAKVGDLIAGEWIVLEVHGPEGRRGLLYTVRNEETGQILNRHTRTDLERYRSRQAAFL